MQCLQVYRELNLPKNINVIKGTANKAKELYQGEKTEDFTVMAKNPWNFYRKYSTSPRKL